MTALSRKYSVLVITEMQVLVLEKKKKVVRVHPYLLLLSLLFFSDLTTPAICVGRADKEAGRLIIAAPRSMARVAARPPVKASFSLCLSQ